jgi:pantothenate kinase
MSAPTRLPVSTVMRTIRSTAELVARCGDIWERAAALGPPRRFVLGIVGVPGSGKSTLAEAVRREFEARRAGSAAVVPMDGFHYTNAELEARGLRGMKGSPETFDAASFVQLLRRARAGEALTFPVYDRALHEPAWRDEPAQTLGGGTAIVVTEGNYLLLDRDPWHALAGVIDECWFLDVPLETARDRILARHRRGGRDAADALAHYEAVDRANAELVVRESRPADVTLRLPTE